MSWISKAENLLNKIDQSAAVVLQQKDENGGSSAGVQSTPPASYPKISSEKQKNSSNNILVLSKATPKKATKAEHDDRWETMSEKSRRSSVSSKHDTVIDQSEKSTNILKESSSSASLNSFSVEKELTASRLLASELRSENNELKNELEQVKNNGNSMKIQELENLCAILEEEKQRLTET